MKKILSTIAVIILIISGISNAQNITNTLGAAGLFKIKDATNDYLTLSQTNGQVNILKTLRLENTTGSEVGVILKGLSRFIHNYGSGNTFVGLNSGNFLLTGNSNTALGNASLFSNTSGSNNTAIGVEALYLNETGESNTANGHWALYSNTTGYGNTAIGRGALYVNTLGNYNTAIGGGAGSTITTGSNLICIGFQSEPTIGSAIGQITLGNSSITTLRCNVTTITSLSDVRDKKNIKDLTLGIDFLMKIKPRQFNWDKREWYESNISDGSKMREEPTAGFIAQELNEVQTTENAEWLNLVLKDNPDKLEATPGNLLPIMVKAIQELKTENNNLKSEIENLKLINEQLSEIQNLKTDLIKQINLLKSESKAVEIKFTTIEE